MGTLGGNICQESRCLYLNQSHNFQFVEPCFKRDGEKCYFLPKGKKCLAVYMADTATALMCLDATLGLVGPDSERQVPLPDFYSKDALQPLRMDKSEVVSQVSIPELPAGNGWSFKKFCLRGGVEFAAVSVAVVMHADNTGNNCSHARIAVGAVAASPVRIEKAEMYLNGKAASDRVFEAAAKMATEETSIVPHHGYSKAYLKEALKIQVTRALKEAWERTRN